MKEQQSTLQHFSKYRPDIDGLRALAVGFVVAFHAFPNIFRYGYIGVDIFFVISGFLITSILLRDERPIWVWLISFYGRRIKRIFPALIAVLATTAIFGYIFLLPNEFRELTKNIAAGAAFLTNIVSWMSTGYFARSAEQAPLLHLWSLAIEEQFYLVWPLVILGLNSKLHPSRFKQGLIILAVSSFVYCLILTTRDQPFAYYHPLTRAWEFLAGAWLAERLKNQGAGKLVEFRADLLVTLAILVLILAGVAIGNNNLFPGAWAILPVFSVTILLGYAPKSWIGKNILSTPFLVNVGKVSYPLYLWHWVLLAFLRIHNPNPSWYLKLMSVLASFGLAWLTYRFIERPIQKKEISKIVPQLSLIMLFVFLISCLDYSYNIFGKRLSPLQQSLQKEYDPRPDYRYRKCFLDSATQGPEDFSKDCIQYGNNKEIRILLWGDSLAAQLYPGIIDTQSNLQFTLIQRTASSCPPSSSSRYQDRGHCDEINADTMKLIEREHPEVVILNGRWSSDSDQQLDNLVKFLRQQSVKKIVLFGPTPDWAPDIRGLLTKMNFSGNQLPDYISPPASTWSVTKEQTENLRKIASLLDIQYIAPIDILCHDELCRIKVTNDLPSGLVASDHDHMTAEASKFLFKNISASVVFNP